MNDIPSAKPRVTIRDVSEAAGVSVATVNRALTGKPRVSEETRRRVMSIAEEMGFRVNLAAKALSRNTIRIGIILQQTIPAFFQDLLSGIQSALAELADFNVQGEITVVSYDSTDESASRSAFLNAMNAYASRGFQGILLLPNRDTTGYADRIDQLRLEGILVGTVVTRVDRCRQAVSVRSDGVAAGHLAAELLFRFGCRRSVVFSSSFDVAICRENIAGYTDWAKQFGLELLHVYQNRDDPALAYAAVDQLAAQYPEADGIYICSANSAAVCRRLVELGLEARYTIVASDLFDDLRQYLQKGLIAATLFQQPRKQGELAVRSLYERIEQEGEDRELLLTPQVVLRGNQAAF